MEPRFSIVYPTRHRPEFIAQALRILEGQRHDSFQVVVCDNYVDPALSCEAACRGSSLANLTYVRPPQPLGMVENWNHALPHATGEYVSYLTDKMFVLPDALGRVERAIAAARGPDIVTWTGDAYNPASMADYFGEGTYVGIAPHAGSDRHRRFSPARDLNRRGRADQARGEQSWSEYSRGKIVFGAYRRELIERIVARYGALFHNINPDYTSLVLGLTAARDAVELPLSCVVSVNTDISNGMLSDTNDAVALAFLNSLTGGAESILPNLLVPGLYVSLHNWVAHDFLTLRSRFGLSFDIRVPNWLVYCIEDTLRPGRQWSDPRVEAQQKGLLSAFLDSLDPGVRSAVNARIAVRARRKPDWRPLRERLRGRRPDLVQADAPSIEAAVERFTAARS
jgi:glycosyl transferase family 2